jgi:hypothetical protein
MQTEEVADEEADEEFYDNDNEAAEVNVDEAITDGDNQPNEQRNNLARDMDQRYGERLADHMTSEPGSPRDYGHMHATLEHTVMTQHSMKRGIKEFGEAGVDAVLKELQQLHDRKVLEPVSSRQHNEGGKACLTTIPNVSEKETKWNHQGSRVRRRKETKSSHNQRGSKLANSGHRGSHAVMCNRRHGKAGTLLPSTYQAHSCRQTWMKPST